MLSACLPEAERGSSRDYRRNDGCQAMSTSDVLFESSIPELPLLGRGKVRDIYSVDDHHLLIVTTDRLSAYDVVLPDPVPGKGEVLTRLSLFWFRIMADIIDNQLTELTGTTLSGIPNHGINFETARWSSSDYDRCPSKRLCAAT